MGIIQKNIPEPKQDEKNIPQAILQRKQNYENAGYLYEYDKKEILHINYNTLRNKRLDREIVDLVKIYRLQDRDTEKEYIVYYQNSKVYDFNNNLVPCPIDESIGVVDNPQTNRILNENNEITDINLIETLNDYTLEFDREHVKRLFSKTRNIQNVVCYAGYTRPLKLRTNDFVDSKRIIKNQNLFLNADFDTLMNLEDKANNKETFKIGKIENKHAMVNIPDKEKLKKTNDPILFGDFNKITETDERQKTATEEAKRNRTQEVADSGAVQPDTDKSVSNLVEEKNRFPFLQKETKDASQRSNKDEQGVPQQQKDEGDGNKNKTGNEGGGDNSSGGSGSTKDEKGKFGKGLRV